MAPLVVTALLLGTSMVTLPLWSWQMLMVLLLSSAATFLLLGFTWKGKCRFNPMAAMMTILDLLLASVLETLKI